MQLEILTFCDAAADYGGRLNIIGATDTLFVPELPYRHPHCALVCRFRVARVEAGEHPVRLVIIDSDARVLVEINGQVNVQMKDRMTGAVNLIVNLNTLEVKQAGEHAIEVAVGGMQIGSSPLFVTLREEKKSDTS